MTGSRLDSGGYVDSSQPINFKFNGKSYKGFVGDSLASALLANGVSVVGRSFKLHRPRGIVGCGAEEPNAIMQIDDGAVTQPNLRATQVELYEGLVAYSTKGWPSVNFDIAALNNTFSRLFGAGFYYKTFMRPKALWHTFERFIRRSAGFGVAPKEADPDHYEHRNAHCDVLVAGAGPAGLMAALAAGKSGAKVILADEQARLGGKLLCSRATIADQSAADWLAGICASLASMDNVTVLSRATVFGYYDHNFLAIAERCSDHLPQAQRKGPRQRLWRVRARQVISAQGAFERPLVFCNNDRPGVMLASAVSEYLVRFATTPGQRAVVFTNNDSAYQTAIDLDLAGVKVEAVIDSRGEGAAELGDLVRARGIAVLQGHIVVDASGGMRLRSIRVAKWSGDLTKSVQASISIDCDLLAVSGGWSPAVHLHSHSGGRNVWNEALHCFVPGETTQACHSIGAANGHWLLSECLQEGLDAGLKAAGSCGFEAGEITAPTTVDVRSNSLQPLWRVPAETDADRCPKQFVDFQNDTSVADIRQAVREGYRNVEHVKRYTALGFGTDQGKLGNINGMAVLAECLGQSIAATGTTTFRPAYTPVTFATIAGENVGELLEPLRTTSIHEWHQEAGAPMEVVGQWHRPWYFPLPNEDIDQSVARECLATRRSLGIMDASTLGKIDVRGPDAVKFLQRIYTHDIAKMKIGKCAYGVMLGEDGMLMDDGVMARLGEQHFYLTTTTGGAAAVLGWLEWWLQTEWPELEVYLTSVTDHFSTIAVVGPNSRRVLEKLGCDLDLGSEEFPFMTVSDAVLADTPVQLFRVSFSGELAFEINIDSRYALSMWRLLMDAGREFDITPYGTETMHVLRAEKGFIIIGQDTDGSVTAADAGLSWLLAKDKDFLGKRSLARPDNQRSDRKQLVGLVSIDEKSVLAEGSQLVVDPDVKVPVPMCGHVTSAYWSATLDKPIALAVLEGGRSRHGESLFAVDARDRRVEVSVVAPVFYDPKSERQND